MNRPKSVTNVAILQLISSIFVILRCVLLLAIGIVFGLIGTTSGGTQVEGFSTIMIAAIIGFAIMILALGSLYFFLVKGLFGLRKWSWIGTMVVNVIILIIDGIMLFGSGISVNFLTLGLAIAILYYLMRPEVRQAFRI
ncbi:hypothetical protein IQ249_24435 [Lusitaniella coriacea LEGE 07157]|uniref:DUF2127 domain-containing protein n=1 Tax=Lusitaniella coriacea LEGE 07157 TaxID=945747 RepID=A0A8J7IXW3_9CYAN|nr:hypothetical protein [Lusitaniella coriacea]MBE9119042.1 hypothetical protein [Lusitaniella coriacea LEGE 07157]